MVENPGDPIFLYKEGSTQAQEDEARWILEALDVAYPGHPWAVRVYGDSTGGGFFIYHLDFPYNYGINCNKKTKIFSASELKRQVILMAGEWLERANLRRGRAVEGDELKRLEGVPERFQPEQRKKPIDVESLVVVGKEAAQENNLIVPDGMA